MKNDTSTLSHEKPVSSRPSFREAVSRAEDQIEMDCIDPRLKAQARELCFIMAEIYLMHPDSHIKISGEELDGYLVQQIFSEITNQHIVLVITNFNRNTYLIKNKKAYLRTALYNSVFELEADVSNVASVAIAGGGKA